jgi:DNA-binding NtrC family response regulator
MEEPGGTLLIADDEALVRRATKRFFKRQGYTVLEAEDGASAVASVKARTGEIAILIMDLTMPNMDGLEAFDQIRTLDPNLPVILCSGYCVEDFPLDRDMLRGKTAFMQKPFSMDGLTRLVDRLRR